MYIEPNTNIRILRNCPLNSTYEHTIFFPAVSAQTAYFTSLTKHNLDKQSYQRVNKGKMRVAIKAEELYDCNYLMFQNISFGTKWFYAFIKTVEYINNITSEIEYEIDVMQTWFFDYQVKPCFVEREHAIDDTIGANTVPENLELGEYVCSEMYDTSEYLSDLVVVVASTFKIETQNIEQTITFNDYHGDMYSGIFSGLCYNVYDPKNPTEYAILKAALMEVGGKADGIVSIFMMPKRFVVEADQVATLLPRVSVPKNITKLGDYTNVKNNKLFTHPYNFLYVTNLQGTSAVFPYEFFNSSDCAFNLTGDMSCSPSVIMYPVKYKGLDVNWDEKIAISGFPNCAFNTDAFKAWLAQNGTSLAVNTVGGVLTSIGAGAFGAALASTPIGAVASLVMGAASAATRVANSVAKVDEALIMPNQAHGSAGSYALVQSGMLNYVLIQKHIKKEFAEIIDNYFSMYGYATNKVKIPNRNGRPHWNYVKTGGANLKGTSGVPSDDMKKLVSIYDNGITFWKKGNELGDYSLDNSL